MPTCSVIDLPVFVRFDLMQPLPVHAFLRCHSWYNLWLHYYFTDVKINISICMTMPNLFAFMHCVTHIKTFVIVLHATCAGITVTLRQNCFFFGAGPLDQWECREINPAISNVVLQNCWLWHVPVCWPMKTVKSSNAATWLVHNNHGLPWDSKIVGPPVLQFLKTKAPALIARSWSWNFGISR